MFRLTERAKPTAGPKPPVFPLDLFAAAAAVLWPVEHRASLE